MPKRTYNQFCPVSRTLDVLGERWTLLIVRDLLRGPRRYTDLRNGLPGMASNLLGDRLTEMEEAGLIERITETEPTKRDLIALTERGRELRPVLLAFGRFGLPYLDAPTDDQPLTPEIIPEAIATLIRVEELPRSGITIEFALDEARALATVSAEGVPGARVDPVTRISVTDDPAEVAAAQAADVVVRGSLGVLLWVRRGDLDLESARADGHVEITGSATAVEEVERMFGISRPVRPG